MYCESCNIYLDNNTAYNKHVEIFKHTNDVKINNGEIIKNGLKFDCVTCETSLRQYSVDQHFKTKTQLDNVNGMDKDNIIFKVNNITEYSTISRDLRSSFTDNATSRDYCDICNTRNGIKKKHIESEQHKENDKEK